MEMKMEMEMGAEFAKPTFACHSLGPLLEAPIGTLGADWPTGRRRPISRPASQPANQPTNWLLAAPSSNPST